MNEYREIRTDEDAAELKKLWSKRNPGVILSVNFHPNTTKTDEKKYRKPNGLEAILIRVLVTKTKPFSEVEIIFRQPVRWTFNVVFCASFVFDLLNNYPKISFLPDLSSEDVRYDAVTKVVASGVEWRYVDDSIRPDLLMQ